MWILFSFPLLSSSFPRVSLYPVLRPRVKYGVYTRAIADIIMARTLRSCVCTVSLAHTGHTPGAGGSWDGIPFKCSANTVTARDTPRGNNPLRSLARSLAYATSLSLSSSSSSRLPDNAFCVRNALYGRGGAAFYRFYIARLTTFVEANRMKNIHLASERANCLRGSRARTSRLRHDKLIIFILSTSLVFSFLFFFLQRYYRCLPRDCCDDSRKTLFLSF